MTSLVGILCKDGVVIGADSAATFTAGNKRTIEQPVDKIEVIQEQVIVAGTGAVGLNQRFCHLVKTKWENGDYKKKSVHEITTSMARAALDDFLHTYVNPTQSEVLRSDYGALVAFPCGSVAQLCEFAMTSLQPELKNSHPWYCSMGSGQLITDAFLGFIRGIFWDGDQPTLTEGIFYTVWTLQQAIDLNPGGINGPIRIAILEKTKNGLKARKLTEEEIGQHQEHMVAARQHLADFKCHLSDVSQPVEPPPKPPS